MPVQANAPFYSTTDMLAEICYKYFKVRYAGQPMLCVRRALPLSQDITQVRVSAGLPSTIDGQSIERCG